MSTSELLLNWVDVARRLWKASHSADTENDLPVLPKGIVFTQTFWDRLLVGVAPDTELQDVWDWLSRLFGPRWVSHSDDGNAILLEAQGESLNRLPVEVEEIDADEVGEWRKISFHPRFTPPRTAYFSCEPGPPPADLPPDHPPILAFHSFKGGVGRTLCALAATLAYTAHHKKVLLVDADFEAPGISFLFEKRMPDPDFAMADLLTMIHADSDTEGVNALASAKKGIAGQRLGDVYVLPCFRYLQDSVSLEIRPEHLVASTAHPPFFLSDILSRLGKELGVDVVIVDLRAGLSDLSSPIILDPRVKRILVANASGQSIRGTRFLIQEIGKVLQSNRLSVGNLPALILNQLPGAMMPRRGESGGDERFSALLESINETMERAFPQQHDQKLEDSTTTTEDSTTPTTETEQPLILTSAEEGITKVYLSYNEPLAVLSDEWEDAMETIRDSLVPDKLWDALQFWLPATRKPERALSAVSTSTGRTLDDKRRLLRDYADQLVTAEGTSAGDDKGVDFLPILPLANLANDHTSKLPIVVSIGAKGAGKTYSYLNIARSGHWDEFVKRIRSDSPCEISAPILPILWSKNADSQEMQSIQKSSRERAGFQKKLPMELNRELSGFASDDLYEWRDFWANAIAKSLIDPEGSSQPYESLIECLRGRTQQIIAIIDGLEEAFPQFAESTRQQTALRALLQELPNWLRTLPGMPLGLIIFVRQDMVLYAIPQNRTQFMDRFKNYALRWTWQEALELAAWVSDKSTATENLRDRDFAKLSEAECSTRLKPLWGYKLGGDGSNEAVSNNWVLSVLSDLRGRIQGRDVVRFLSLAAKESVGNPKSTDCLLAPVAMRAAIQECSRKKVAEIGEENKPLEEVFGKIMGSTPAQPQGSLISPCTYGDLASFGLNRDQVELLEANGVVFFDEKGKKYHFPEIFRYGLNVERNSLARPRVVSLLRQARNQGRF